MSSSAVTVYLSIRRNRPNWRDVDENVGAGKLSPNGDTITRVEDRKVMWEEATVTEGGGTISLRVRVDDIPSPAWRRTFEAIASARDSEAHGLRWGGVVLQTDWVTVDAVNPGSEHDLKDYVDRIVSATNEQRGRDRQAEEQAEQDQQFRSEAAAKQAEQMQERIRTPRTD